MRTHGHRHGHHRRRVRIPGITVRAFFAAIMVLCHAPGYATDDPFGPGGTASHASARHMDVEVSGDSVSVKARGAPIAAVLEEIARQAGLEVRMEGAVAGATTINLDHVSLPKALHWLLQGRNFALQYGARDAGSGSVGGLAVTPRRGRLWVFSNDGDKSAGQAAADDSPAREDQGDTLERHRFALSSDDPRLRVEAVSALAEIGGEEASAALAAPLLDADPWVRQEAAYAIGATGGETAALTLQAAVADSDMHVRQAAIEALAYADAAASTRVLAVALHDPEPALRAQAVQVLGDLGGGGAIELLHQALNDRDREVRREAIYAFRRVGGDAAAEALRRAMADAHPDMRREAIRGLGALRSESVRPLVRQGLDDPDASVRQTARNVLDRLDAGAR